MSMSVDVCAAMSEVAWLEQGRASRGQMLKRMEPRPRD